MWLYQVAPAFTAELERELAFFGCESRRQEGPFLFAENGRDMAWAQWTWPDAELFQFASIGQAVKFLRSKDKRWWNASVIERRRSVLMAEQLGSPREKLLEFGKNIVQDNFSAFALLSKTELVFSQKVFPAVPDGLYRFAEDKSAPSRAYLKLWEALTRAAVLPQVGERCLDLGSSPGGWTWVLARVGAQVISVDRASLAKSLQTYKNIEFRQVDAFSQTPKLVGAIDWLVSDIICYPEKLFSFVSDWKRSGQCKNYICTIKFKGEADPIWIERFRSLGGQVLHLCANKHEVTWIDVQR